MSDRVVHATVLHGHGRLFQPSVAKRLFDRRSRFLADDEGIDGGSENGSSLDFARDW